MTRQSELLILGAGPAGIGAALSATACGLKTTIVDSAPSSGGQVYRALPFQRRSDAEFGVDRTTGDYLHQALLASSVTKAFGHLVWSVGQDYRVDALGPTGPEQWQADALIVASGTSERVVPFPGWTLPGVIGLAAATILLKSQLILPGRNTLVAGCGPLLTAVAHGIVHNGGKVVAVLDLASPKDWRRALPAMLNRPRDLIRGLRWQRELRAAGVPYLHRHSILAVQPHAQGLEIIAGRVDAQGRARDVADLSFVTDCVTVGHGLIPATEITRLLRAQHHYVNEAGGWVPILDSDQRSSREFLYVAGDGSGISGAVAAQLAGRIAGYTAALDLGRLNHKEYQRLTHPLRNQLKRATCFGQAMARMMALRPGQVSTIPADTVICRCEDITRAEIDDALEQGAIEVNQLKSWTRCGMGPCQGRSCGDTVAALVAERVGGREQAGIWNARVPLRPLDLATLSGRFDYADIPIPKAAPL